MGEQKEWLKFAEMFKAYRIDKGMSQADFGDQFGYMAEAISKVESGARAPTVYFVEAFTASMNMSEGEAEIWHLLGAKANGWKV